MVFKNKVTPRKSYESDCLEKKAQNKEPLKKV